MITFKLATRDCRVQSQLILKMFSYNEQILLTLTWLAQILVCIYVTGSQYKCTISYRPIQNKRANSSKVTLIILTKSLALTRHSRIKLHFLGPTCKTVGWLVDSVPPRQHCPPSGRSCHMAPPTSSCSRAHSPATGGLWEEKESCFIIH